MEKYSLVGICRTENFEQNLENLLVVRHNSKMPANSPGLGLGEHVQVVHLPRPSTSVTMVSLPGSHDMLNAPVLLAYTVPRP